MAHGVIPPFSNYLISRDFFCKVPMDQVLTKDVLLLGEASNEVIVACEVAQMLQGITRLAYHDYLAYGFIDLRDSDGTFRLSERRFVSVLVAVMLDLNGAGDALAKLLPHMRDSQSSAWRLLVDGAMDSTIRVIEDELGQIVKNGSKDVCVHVPEEVGHVQLERLLSCN